MSEEHDTLSSADGAPVVRTRSVARLAAVAFLVVLLLDQWSKQVLLFDVGIAGRVIEVTSFFNLVMVWNHGVSFGLFAADDDSRRWLLIAVALAICAVLCWLVWRQADRFQALAYGMIIGGAIGNVIDRIRFGAVADFFDVHLYGYHWPAFNIADSAIVIGVAMLLYDSIVRQRPSAT